MKVRSLLLAASVAVLTIGPLAAVSAKKLQPVPTHPAATTPIFPIKDVIAQVKKELAAAQASTSGNVGLKLDSVDLTFALATTRDINGKVSVGIPLLTGLDVGGNGGKKVEETSSLQITLAPPTPINQVAGYDTTSLGITQAIIDTRTQLAAGLDVQPRLDPTKVVITLKFGVIRTGGGTGQIRFLFFALGGGTTFTSANTNTITLNLSRPKGGLR